MESDAADCACGSGLEGGYMILSRERLISEASACAFRPEIFEKVARLLSLLNALGRHPRLKGRWALKGGTALNLFCFDVPRLSVDIDLNYLGNGDRDLDLSDRPEIERAIEVVGESEGMVVVRAPDDHAGGKWQLRYSSVLGQSGNIEIDLNYMFRIPLWPIRNVDSRSLGNLGASRVPVLDLHELAGPGSLRRYFHAVRVEIFSMRRHCSRSAGSTIVVFDSRSSFTGR
jgi:hypothetical protein